jgi:hypothetical protein
LLVAAATQAGIDMAAVFRWVFVASDIFFALALIALLLMEERPLYGSATPTAPAPSQPSPAPAE